MNLYCRRRRRQKRKKKSGRFARTRKGINRTTGYTKGDLQREEEERGAPIASQR